MKSRTRLTFPEARARPNQSPDFSDVRIPPAGALDVPPLDIEARHCRAYANGLIRVLNDDGDAVGPWADYVADLDRGVWLQGLRDMLKMRAFDERMMNAQRQGKTSFYMQCSGEEAIGCGFGRRLSPGDMNFPTYRQQTLLVAADYPLREMMGQIYSNECDPTEGRQTPILHSSRQHGRRDEKK